MNFLLGVPHPSERFTERAQPWSATPLSKLMGTTFKVCDNTDIREKSMERWRDTAQLKDEMSLDLGKCGAQGLTDGPRPILKPDGASGESENNGHRRL